MRFFISAFILLALSTQIVAAQSKPQCLRWGGMRFDLNSVEFGKQCGSETSVFVRSTSHVASSVKIRVRVCLQANSGKWDCVSDYLDYGEDKTAWNCDFHGAAVIEAVMADGTEYDRCFYNPNTQANDTSPEANLKRRMFFDNWVNLRTGRAHD